MFPCYTLIIELITRNLLLRCMGLLFPPDFSVRHEWSLWPVSDQLWSRRGAVQSNVSLRP